MKSGRVSLVAVALAVAGSGCGSSAADRTPTLSDLPLVPGSQITTQVKRCDKGSSAFCALEMVIVDRHFRSSDDLVHSERNLLRHNGWSGASPDVGPELAADSPGHKLRVTYASAFNDLSSIDFGWIERPKEIRLALSRTMFAGEPAMSLMLEVGNG